MQGGEKNSKSEGRGGGSKGSSYKINRLEYIRLKLRRGDKKKIAETLDIHPEWVSQVIRGKGVSEPVLLEAERIIRERE